MAAATGTTLPHALSPSGWQSILSKLQKAAHVLLLLDYDGTLTPIVRDPDAAALPEATRDTLLRLCQRFPHTAVLTGRSAEKIRAFLGPELSSRLQLGASHGFDIQGPHANQQVGREFLPALQQAVTDIDAALKRAGIEGAAVEDNVFSVTVHYRNVLPARVPEVTALVEAYLAGQDRLIARPGNCVIELRPAMEWHKGKAAAALINALGLNTADTAVIMVGDDVTDEDAFNELTDPAGTTYQGIPIIVSAGARGASLQNRSTELKEADTIVVPRLTAAHYALASPDEVRSFLDSLCSLTELSVKT